MPEIPAVSIIARMADRFLLVERANPPAAGKFAFPGGKAQPGETMEEAARREMREETMLEVERLTFFRTLHLPETDGVAYRLDIFLAEGFSGTLEAADDARSAGWFSLNDMKNISVTQSTHDIAMELTAHNCGEVNRERGEA